MTFALPELTISPTHDSITAKTWRMDNCDSISVVDGTPSSLHDVVPGLENLTIVIENRALVRDCLVRCLIDSHLPGAIRAFASVDECLVNGPLFAKAPLVLLCTGERKSADLERDWLRLMRIPGGSALVVLVAQDEETHNVRSALNGGVRGYIPTSLPLSVAIEAMHLVRAGGVFIPASCINTATAIVAEESVDVRPKIELLFTTRQIAVIEALRKGKANKVIAYELDMAESTVKVHVRNVMRRLKARNRTEVAFLINRLDSNKP